MFNELAKKKAKSSKNKFETLADVPAVFLSFDEPNADENWNYLKSIAPENYRLKRVHGVLGFDAAHKAAAEQFPNDEYVVTVDADNRVDTAFFNKSLPSNIGLGFSYTWAGRQFTNGLLYGNGGIKLWNRQHLLNMNSHENSKDNKDSVDFCWDILRYKELPNCYSTVYTNGSAYQAFRVGFREGIKLCLDQGEVIDSANIQNEMHAANYQRLLTWMTVGSDVGHGVWSIYAARLAVKMLYFENFDYTLIRNYEWFTEFFKTQESLVPAVESASLSVELGNIFGFRMPNFTAEESSFIKRLQLHAERPLSDDDVKWRTNLKMFGWFS